jgi:hypothetical protein
MQLNLIFYAFATLTPFVAAGVAETEAKRSLGDLVKRDCAPSYPPYYCNPSDSPNDCCSGNCAMACGPNGCIWSCDGAAGPP